MMEKQNKKPNPKAVHNTPMVQSLSQPATADTDPMGSYTGVPLDPNETPIQDADDL